MPHKTKNAIDYDGIGIKKRVNKKKLDSIIYFLKMMNVDVEIKTNSPKKEKKEELFSKSFGMWADRDINIKEIRQKAHERRTKLYDNAGIL